MKDLPEDAPGIGDNNPPLWDEEMRAALEVEARDYADAAGDWIEAGEVSDQEEAGKINDFLTQGRALSAKIEKIRKTEKEPHLEAGRAVDDAFKTLNNIVTTAGKAVKPFLEAFLQEQRRIEAEQRRAAEEKARKEAEVAENARREAAARNDIAGQVEADARAEEAEKAKAEAQKPSETRVGSATGMSKKRGLRKVKTAEIQNDLMALRHFREHEEVRALLVRLATAQLRAKGGPDKIPGFKTVIKEVL